MARRRPPAMRPKANAATSAPPPAVPSNGRIESGQAATRTRASAVNPPSPGRGGCAAEGERREPALAGAEQRGGQRRGEHHGGKEAEGGGAETKRGRDDLRGE